MINDATNSIWTLINQTTPFSSPGVIDGQLIVTPEERFDNKINLGNSALPKCYGTGYSTAINNTMNLDLLLNQKLDFSRRLQERLDVQNKEAQASFFVVCGLASGG